VRVGSLSVAVGGYKGGMRSSSVVFVHAFQCFQHDNRVAADDLNRMSLVWCGVDDGDERTTWPILTFSPPAFSSTASSRTMFRKT
jgi:hypothetical protein